MTKKLHTVDFNVSVGSFLGPAPWSLYPEGVELVHAPTITFNGRNASIRLTVRCEPEIGRQMGWIPFEKEQGNDTRTD